MTKNDLCDTMYLLNDVRSTTYFNPMHFPNYREVYFYFHKYFVKMIINKIRYIQRRNYNE